MVHVHMYIHVHAPIIGMVVIGDPAAQTNVKVSFAVCELLVSPNVHCSSPVLPPPSLSLFNRFHSSHSLPTLGGGIGGGGGGREGGGRGWGRTWRKKNPAESDGEKTTSVVEEFVKVKIAGVTMDIVQPMYQGNATAEVPQTLHLTLNARDMEASVTSAPFDSFCRVLRVPRLSVTSYSSHSGSSGSSSVDGCCTSCLGLSCDEAALTASPTQLSFLFRFASSWSCSFPTVCWSGANSASSSGRGNDNNTTSLPASCSCTENALPLSLVFNGITLERSVSEEEGGSISYSAILRGLSGDAFGEQMQEEEEKQGEAKRQQSSAEETSFLCGPLLTQNWNTVEAYSFPERLSGSGSTGGMGGGVSQSQSAVRSEGNLVEFFMTKPTQDVEGIVCTYM